MGSRRFKSRLTRLQYIKFLDSNKLKWNFGANYKNKIELKNLRRIVNFELETL